jgi:hypothetical protein
MDEIDGLRTKKSEGFGLRDCQCSSSCALLSRHPMVGRESVVRRIESQFVGNLVNR